MNKKLDGKEVNRRTFLKGAVTGIGARVIIDGNVCRLEYRKRIIAKCLPRERIGRYVAFYVDCDDCVAIERLKCRGIGGEPFEGDDESLKRITGEIEFCPFEPCIIFRNNSNNKFEFETMLWEALGELKLLDKEIENEHCNT